MTPIGPRATSFALSLAIYCLSAPPTALAEPVGPEIPRTRVFAAVDLEASGDAEVDRNRLVEEVRAVASEGARFITLPERIAPVPEPVPGPSSRRFGALARELDVWIALSLPEKVDGGFHVTTILLDPQGDIVSRNRKVLAHSRRDGEGVVRGDYRAMLEAIDIDGWRVGILAADDLQVGVPRLATRGADVILIPAFWRPTDRQPWQEQAKELAREYVLDIVVANRRESTDPEAPDGEGVVPGAIYRRDGRVLETTPEAVGTDLVGGGGVMRRVVELEHRQPEWPIPSALGLPSTVPVPSHEPVAAEIAELGRRLFFDPGLSSTGKISCASCHKPELAFTNGERKGIGVHGRTTKRNVPSLLNVAFRPLLQWDGYGSSLENFVKYPLSGRDEMDLHFLDDALPLLRNDPTYVESFRRTMGAETIEFTHVERALATYQRTLISGNSPFDRFYYGGENDALSPPARRGYELFVGSAGCVDCHTIGERYALFMDFDFHFLGVGFDPEPGVSKDIGLGSISTDSLAGLFQTPSLRNVALTAPYMHDGSFETLEEVVEFYAAGGDRSGERKPDLRPLRLDEEQKRDLIAFLVSLTGDHRYSADGRRLSSDLGSGEKRVATQPAAAHSADDAGHEGARRVSGRPSAN